MTKDEKIEKRKKRGQLRRHKRFLKDEEAYYKAYWSSRNSISWGRRRLNGTIFECEMGYSGCELRGYCNVDC